MVLLTLDNYGWIWHRHLGINSLMSFRDEESLNLKVRVDNDKDLLYCLDKNLFLAKIVKNFAFEWT